MKEIILSFDIKTGGQININHKKGVSKIELHNGGNRVSMDFTNKELKQLVRALEMYEEVDEDHNLPF